MMRAVPIVVLALFALINLGRGGIHVFAPDGGAHSIAGLDLSTNRQTIVALFASLGFSQMAMGAFQGFVVLARRDLVALFLAMQAVMTTLGLVNLYLYRPLPVTVPGQPFNVVLLGVALVALALALRAGPRRA
jgi:hypothetical protein